MAEFSVSVAESTNVFGGAPTDTWGTYAWNAFLWGEGTASMVVGAFVVVAETQASTEAVENAPAVGVSEACTAAGTMVSGFILDEQGYYRVFPADTTDGEQRDTPTWSEGSATTPSWSSAAVTAPTWSEA